jgi:hypothetical protein
MDMKNILFNYIALVSLLIPFLGSAFANERNYVGYASMRIIRVEESSEWDKRKNYLVKDWNYNLKDLAKEGYLMTYTSFKKVVSKLRETRMRPKTLELIDANILLTPENIDALNEFHNNIDLGFDNYLSEIADKNACRLIIYNSIEPHRVIKFILGKQEKMLITVMVYYLDSNSVGMKYIPIKKNSFRDFIHLKSIMHQAITEALEEAIVNSAGLMTASPQPVVKQLTDSNKKDNPPMKPKKSFQQQLLKGASNYGDAWD